MLAAMLDELSHVGTFVNEQVRAGMTRDDVLAAQHSAITSRLQQLKDVSCESGSQLTSSINAGPWTDELKAKLAAVVLRLQMGHVAASSPRRKFQHCLAFEQYMTASEWAGLQGNAIRSSKICQICMRAWSLGIVVPSEKTTWRMASIIVQLDSVIEDDDKKQVHEDIKTQVKILDNKHKHPKSYWKNTHPIRLGCQRPCIVLLIETKNQFLRM